MKNDKRAFLIRCEIWTEHGELHREFIIDRNHLEGRQKMAKSAKWSNFNRCVFVTYDATLTR